MTIDKLIQEIKEDKNKYFSKEYIQETELEYLLEDLQIYNMAEHELIELKEAF